MKKIYTLLAFSLLTLFVNATVHTVSVANFSFTPATINANCDDTVKWVWSSGTHTTSSTSVPVGASAWNQNINANTTTYSLTVTVAGTYSYQCNIHTSMQGTITVTCLNGIASINNNFSSSAYPVPFSNKLTIETSDADMIALYNIVGEKIRTITLPHGQTKTEINTVDLKDGIYLYSILKEGVVVETRKIVKN